MAGGWSGALQYAAFEGVLVATILVALAAVPWGASSDEKRLWQVLLGGTGLAASVGGLRYLALHLNLPVVRQLAAAHGVLSDLAASTGVPPSVALLAVLKLRPSLYTPAMWGVFVVAAAVWWAQFVGKLNKGKAFQALQVPSMAVAIVLCVLSIQCRAAQSMLGAIACFALCEPVGKWVHRRGVKMCPTLNADDGAHAMLALGAYCFGCAAREAC